MPEGPSGWISPLVVVLKSDGDVRVCVDMRRANEVIIRERRPIPRVEELLHDLNGSTVFSKVDLKWGFQRREPTYHNVCGASWSVSLQEVNVWRYFCPRKVLADSKGCAEGL